MRHGLPQRPSDIPCRCRVLWPPAAFFPSQNACVWQRPCRHGLL